MIERSIQIWMTFVVFIQSIIRLRLPLFRIISLIVTLLFIQSFTPNYADIYIHSYKPSSVFYMNQPLSLIQKSTILYRTAYHQQIRAFSISMNANNIYDDKNDNGVSTTNKNQEQQQHLRPNHVCIVGGGVIGTSTAYYLATQYNIKCTIIDRTGTIASAASGKAGGFLAYNWNDGTSTEQLTHRSYQLHELLATKFTPESIQYRKLSCVSMSIHPTASLSSPTKRNKPNSRKLQNVEWASSSDTVQIQNVRSLGTETTIAQVHPKLLCERLWYETQLAVPSCQVIKGTVNETIFTSSNDSDMNHTTVSGVMLDDGTIINADAVLYACGPWNVLQKRTTGELHTSMKGIKYHSLIVPTKRIYKQCVFFHGLGDPEVYVRPDQTAYCTGYPEPPRIVQEIPGQESIDPNKISTIYNAIQQVVSTPSITSAEHDMDDDSNDDIRPGLLLENREQMIQQACYLPSTDDGIPMMGSLFRNINNNNNKRDGIANGSGVYIATGHSCWGILLGPGTGECMASLIATGESTKYVNLDEFDPYRFI